mmetsp:Transcript_12218/g.44580  ORF Transcript_12218/g.44580 Transcript_12218/m.44580 type:complete len:181 (-) Transcript_12218:1444-1986(-)
MVSFRYHQYQIVGRKRPTEKEPTPKLYRMKVWATNDVRAKSKFWYYMSMLKKVKKSNGETLACNEIYEKDPYTVKNYGIWLRYRSRSGEHNMYKEYRDVTLNGAIQLCYSEMASRHRARHSTIQIIKTGVVPDEKVKRVNNQQFLDKSVKFPTTLHMKKLRAPNKSMKTIFKASRPNTFT